MPYALIPDGYSLKKVTKLQKQALTDKRRHDNVMALLNNENTPLIVGGLGLLAATPLLVDWILGLLDEQNVTVTDTQKEAIKRGIILGPAPAIIFKKVTDFDLSDFSTKFGDFKIKDLKFSPFK